MATKILTNVHGDSVQNLYEEDGKVFLDFNGNFSEFLSQNQRDFNDSCDVYARGNKVFVEAYRLPEEIYWYWRQMAVSKGCKTPQEIQNWIYTKLNSPEFSKFKVNKAAGKLKMK